MPALCRERWVVTEGVVSTVVSTAPPHGAPLPEGGYVTHRVFFATEEDARTAGYRPCAVCLSDAYTTWKAQQGGGYYQRSGEVEELI